ncbi:MULTISPECIES: hypothetical protein [unclassified Bartonella]|uniref:hypothetical protein n=1 Tax=unclassified Bartonella TaxID=2645622 RepID=UPI002361F567|nr:MULTISPECIES: hypothetical protein [unclassified Bartonella]
MTIDKPQHGFLASEAVIVSGQAFDEASKLFSFKKSLALSTKDYVIICCLAVILLVFFAAMAYINPLEYFHVISKEQFEAIAQENLRAMGQENIGKQVFEAGALLQKHFIELWRAAGWNGVWALICCIPIAIFGFVFGFFPLLFIFCAVLKREVKGMIQQWEKSLELQNTNYAIDRGGE